MILFITLILLSLIFFVNSIYYSLILLVVIVSLLFFIASSGLVSSLTMIILCVVYVGAMTILIGYICAICPNIIVESFSKILLIVCLSTFLSLIFNSSPFLNFSASISIVSYFYSSSGVFIFSVVVFMLFLTLLMVTSQYSRFAISLFKSYNQIYYGIFYR